MMVLDVCFMAAIAAVTVGVVTWSICTPYRHGGRHAPPPGRDREAGDVRPVPDSPAFASHVGRPMVSPPLLALVAPHRTLRIEVES